MKLVIDRKRWLRGVGTEESMLLRASDRKMCCLGFLGVACGLTEDHLREGTIPSDLDSEEREAFPEWLLDNWKNETQAGWDLIDANDSVDLDDATRERRLGEIFHAHGVEVSFVN